MNLNKFITLCLLIISPITYARTIISSSKIWTNNNSKCTITYEWSDGTKTQDVCYFSANGSHCVYNQPLERVIIPSISCSIEGDSLYIYTFVKGKLTNTSKEQIKNYYLNETTYKFRYPETSIPTDNYYLIETSTGIYKITKSDTINYCRKL